MIAQWVEQGNGADPARAARELAGREVELVQRDEHGLREVERCERRVDRQGHDPVGERDLERRPREPLTRANDGLDDAVLA